MSHPITLFSNSMAARLALASWLLSPLIYALRRVVSSFEGNFAPISSNRRRSMSQMDLFSNIVDTNSKLYIKSSNGAFTIACDETIFDAARGAIERKYPERSKMDSTEKAARYLRMKLSGLNYEVFGAMFLNTQLELITYREMFRGTINQAAVYPRDVAKAALDLNASSLIISHNHPSGLAEPSTADLMLTNHLKKARSEIGRASCRERQ